MIGIVTVGTNDMPRARRFYDALMPLLGASLDEARSTDDRAWYMIDASAPRLAVTKPFDGRPATVGNGTMIALAASGPDNVAAVHARALELGAADEGAPGYRSPNPGDPYRAYFRDLDGNKFMVYVPPLS
ncbi:MAG: VOC family protein [Bradyrhizobium sp.]